MDKYPNVFLTQGLMDLGKMDLVDSCQEKKANKITIIAQIVDDEYPIPDDGEEPIGFDKDPWEDAFDYDTDDLDNLLGDDMPSDGLSEEDFINDQNLQEPKFDMDVDGFGGKNLDWQNELKKWFKKRE